VGRPVGLPGNTARSARVLEAARAGSVRVILGTGCLGGRALDGEAIAAALAVTGLRRALLVVNGAGNGGGNGSGGAHGAASVRGLPVAGVRASWGDLAAALDIAARARAPRLVLELPSLFGLERACRELHALSSRAPGLAWAIATPDGGPLAEPGQLALLLDDLAAQRPGYWHRPSRAALLGHGDAAWLDACGRHFAGASLDDIVDGKAGLPPGLGSVDLRVCAELLPAGADVALDVEPLNDISLLRFTCEQLRRVGFHG
jgi:hypothetical protein